MKSPEVKLLAFECTKKDQHQEFASFGLRPSSAEHTVTAGLENL